MENKFIQLNDEENQKEIRSSDVLILLYSIGALIGLCLSFKAGIDPKTAVECLVLSWLLSVIALGISVASDVRDLDFEEN
jgi:hypothetical protein